MTPVLWFVGVTAAGGAAGFLGAQKNQAAAGFCGLSVLGRVLLSACGVAAVVWIVMLSGGEPSAKIQDVEMWVTGLLLLSGLVCYAVGQKIDGSDRWQREREKEAEAQARAQEEENRYG